MIAITNDQLDEMAGTLWLTDVRNHQYDPENVSSLKVHRIAVEQLCAILVADLVKNIWGTVYSRSSYNYNRILQKVRKELRET
mgnify:CR=1 FL=1